MKNIQMLAAAAASTLVLAAPARSQDAPPIDITHGFLLVSGDRDLKVYCTESAYPTILGIIIDTKNPDGQNHGVFAARIDWKGRLVQVAKDMAVPEQIIPEQIGKGGALAPVSKDQQERFNSISPLLFGFAAASCQAAEAAPPASPPPPSSTAPSPKTDPSPDTQPSPEGVPYPIPVNFRGRHLTPERAPA